MRSDRAGFVTAVVLLCGFFVFAATARADTYFIGVGNDGYFTDVKGLYKAMSLWDPWPTPSADNMTIISGRSLIQWSPDPNVILLNNQGGGGIGKALSYFGQLAGPDDIVMFFYSGHGGPGPDIDPDEFKPDAIPDGDEEIGLLGDPNWIRDDQIAEILGTWNSEATIVSIFDACNSGGMVGGQNDLDHIGNDNVAVITGSAEGEDSYGGFPYSLLTQELIDALGPGLPGDLNDDGYLYADEWYAYAYEHINLGTQAPQFFSDYDAAHNQPLFYESGPALSLGVPAEVPEPATVLFLLSGGAVLALVRRRRAS